MAALITLFDDKDSKGKTRTKEGPNLVHKYDLTHLEVHASGSLSMEECGICFNTGQIQIKLLPTLLFYFS